MGKKSNKATIKKLSKALSLLSDGIEKLCENEDVKSAVLGKYSDGDTRSLIDAAFGEFLSPKQKKKMLNKENKKCKKK